MLEPKSSSPMPSAWAVSLLWEVTIPTTITVTSNTIRIQDENEWTATYISVSIHHTVVSCMRMYNAESLRRL